MAEGAKTSPAEAELVLPVDEAMTVEGGGGGGGEGEVAVTFKEESNRIEDLVDPEKKALDEFKVLIQEALKKREFTPSPPPPAPAKQVEKKDQEEINALQVTDPPPEPEEVVSVWGNTLLADEKTDVILLKFLRARDFKVNEAFAMLKSVISWRKEFKIDQLLNQEEEEEEDIIAGLEKVVYIHGVDKEGHPVSYNTFGEFQDKELYAKAFSDGEKRDKFLRWYIQFLEKNIRKLDFTREGISTIVQIIDLKNSPGFILFKKELRQSTNQALQLLQDNYPEFVAKQVFVNVPWWYVAYNRLISPFLTQRTKSKFVFAGPTRTAETLLRYIAPEQLPVQYGGLSLRDGDHHHHQFSPTDPATEEILKPTSKHTIEIPVSSERSGSVIWEARVIGWDVSYGAEFVPNGEGSYTWIVDKARKIDPTDERFVVSYSFKIAEAGKIVLTFDNQLSRKKKKLIYRFKIMPSFSSSSPVSC